MDFVRDDLRDEAPKQPDGKPRPKPSYLTRDQLRASYEQLAQRGGQAADLAHSRLRGLEDCP